MTLRHFRQAVASVCVTGLMELIMFPLFEGWPRGSSPLNERFQTIGKHLISQEQAFERYQSQL
jgi:hypothetical protein